MTADDDIALDDCREKVPMAWARTQQNLGVALRKLGTLERDTTQLHAAVEACQLALEEYEPETAPLEWTTAQADLGITLSVVGGFLEDGAVLERAVSVLNAALTIAKEGSYWGLTETIQDAIERAQSMHLSLTGADSAPANQNSRIEGRDRTH